MSKPKIFQQMESAGSFWITDDNANNITLIEIYNKYHSHIPVFLCMDDTGKNLYQLVNCRLSSGTYTCEFSRTNGTTTAYVKIKGSANDIFNTNYNNSEGLSSSGLFHITNKTGDTMTGSLLAKAGIANSRQMRNITLSTAEPSSGENGDVWIQYEE